MEIVRLPNTRYGDNRPDWVDDMMIREGSVLASSDRELWSDLTDVERRAVFACRHAAVNFLALLPIIERYMLRLELRSVECGAALMATRLDIRVAGIAIQQVLKQFDSMCAVQLDLFEEVQEKQDREEYR